MPKDKKLQVLEVIKKESLPKGRKGRHATAAYQVDDGTIFYRVRHPPDTLFVKCGGDKIVAQLPEDCIYNCGAHGDAVYFETASHKLYKASFSPPDGITVTHLRNGLEALVMIFNCLQNEEFLPGALCTRNEDGTLYVYRMSDDPDVDAIYVDTSSDDLYGARLVGVERRQCVSMDSSTKLLIVIQIIFRNVVVFEIRDDSLNKPSARRLNDSVILLEVPPSFSPPFTRDSFVYIVEGVKLMALNTNTMEFLPSVQIGNSMKISSIIGVHKDVVTVIAEEGEEAPLISARLFDGYF
ncbi:hypothetical protein PRIPAC_89475 [Pristionchus pacificus]|uniref:Uncharacterized protein n=1 Tax=Pristionchus pacificus TaxID=54126 RepID=A0A2A6CY51_PRIPA|nr:hypothetical protein PRIPAC_89475 [Pristionchus pacificus]|eukprot:PDM82953.1 hypothetical protein PRIPAC_37346 [Pristionchus pacificus]